MCKLDVSNVIDPAHHIAKISLMDLGLCKKKILYPPSIFREISTHGLWETIPVMKFSR